MVNAISTVSDFAYISVYWFTQSRGFLPLINGSIEVIASMCCLNNHCIHDKDDNTPIHDSLSSLAWISLSFTVLMKKYSTSGIITC